MGDSNGEESEGGHHSASFRHKKRKGKALKWRSSNGGMNGKVEAEWPDGDDDDTVPSPVTPSSFSSLKRVRTLGKVAEDYDSVNPKPVPRKLRSAINKRAAQTVPASPRNFKKRRYLSIISTTPIVDHETRLSQSLLGIFFTKEEEAVAEALLLLSQMPPLCEQKSDNMMSEDRPNINVTSTSYSEGAIEIDKIIASPSADDEVANQSIEMDQPVERTDNAPQVKPMADAVHQPHHIIDPPLSDHEHTQDASLGIIANLPSGPSASKNSSKNNARKQLKVQFYDKPTYPAQQPEVSQWLVTSNKSEAIVHEEKKANNTSTQEIAPLVQTPLPCTSHGSSSSTLAACSNTAPETIKVPSTGNFDKLPSIKTGGSTKAWKRCMTHVNVSHLIQMHLHKKALLNQVKPEMRSNSHISTSPNGPTFNKNNIDERFYAVHWDVRLPAPLANRLSDTTTGRQNIVNGNFVNLPTSAALPGTQNIVNGNFVHSPASAAVPGTQNIVNGNFMNSPASAALPRTQHVQYFPPPVTSHGPAMPFPFPSHLPYPRGNLPPAAMQQVPHYMCNPGYVPLPGLPGSSNVMNLQPPQMPPPPRHHQHHHQHHQQQPMWQFHVPQYQAPPNAPPALWQNGRVQDMASLRPMSMLPPPMPHGPPQMELFCAPYQFGNRPPPPPPPPPQLRLI